MIKKIAISCLLLVSMLLFNACSEETFDGSRTGNENQFIISYDIFTGSDSQTLPLKADDVLWVEVISEKGSINLEIKEQDSKAVYTGTDMPDSSFRVTVPQDGDYIISVIGKKAKGSVSVIKKENDK